MKDRENIFAEIDWFTIGLYFLMVFLGWINIYSAVYNEENSSILDFSQRYGKQLIWIGMAVIFIIIVFIIDAKFFSAIAFPVYIAMMLLLIGVLLFGVEVNGARSWIAIGSFRLQPAEFAKFATGLAIASYLSSFNFKIHNIKSLFYIGIILFIPAALILLQNDTGSAIVYIAFFLVLYREGLSAGFLFTGVFAVILFILAMIFSLTTLSIIILATSLIAYWLFRRDLREILFSIIIFAISFTIFYLIGNYTRLEMPLYFIIFSSVILSGLFYLLFAYRFRNKIAFVVTSALLGSFIFTSSVDYVFNNVLEQHQQDRIRVVLGLLSDPQGVGYNVTQSKIAIGSGGIVGKGFLQGTQTKFDFVPEQSTDFIFCTVGEEWGFLGTSTVVLLFVVLLLRLIYLAERQRSNFNRIYGWGVVSIIFFHFVINIAMTIGLAPVIGIPLPFFSYGGSSLWGFTLLLFVFLKLDSSRKAYLQ